MYCARFFPSLATSTAILPSAKYGLTNATPIYPTPLPTFDNVSSSCELPIWSNAAPYTVDIICLPLDAATAIIAALLTVKLLFINPEPELLYSCGGAPLAPVGLPTGILCTYSLNFLLHQIPRIKVHLIF